MSSDEKKKLGERIRRARHEVALKQDELAARLGISQGVISNVETGTSTIDVPDLPKWAEALNKPIMYFYMDDTLSLQQRTAAVLSMFPEDRMEFVLNMLQNMALTMRQDKPKSINNGH